MTSAELTGKHKHPSDGSLPITVRLYECNGVMVMSCVCVFVYVCMCVCVCVCVYVCVSLYTYRSVCVLMTGVC